MSEVYIVSWKELTHMLREANTGGKLKCSMEFGTVVTIDLGVMPGHLSYQRLKEQAKMLEKEE